MLFNEGDASNNKCYVVVKGRVVVIRKISKSPIKREAWKEDRANSDVMDDSDSLGSESESDFSMRSSGSTFSDSSDDLLEDNELERRLQASRNRGRSDLKNLSSLASAGINSPLKANDSKRKSFFRGSIQLKIEPVVSKAFEKIAKKAADEKKERKMKKLGKVKSPKSRREGLLNGVSEFSKQVINGYGVPVAIVENGEMFGQFALVNNDNRNAAIFTIENCEFMIFHKKHFNFIKKFFSKEFNERRNFIENVIPPIADELAEKKKMHFIQNFTQTRFQRVKKSLNFDRENGYSRRTSMGRSYA